MKIKILKSCSGHKFSFKQGDIADVEDYIGKDLIGCGFAEKAAKAANNGTETEKAANYNTVEKKTPVKTSKKGGKRQCLN